MSEFLDHAITVRDLVNVAVYSISVLFVFLLTLAVLRLRDQPVKRPPPLPGAERSPPRAIPD